MEEIVKINRKSITFVKKIGEMDLDNKKIGACVQSIRKKKKIKQSEVAELLETTQAVISDFERGDRNWNTEWLNNMARAIGTTATEIIYLAHEGDKNKDDLGLAMDLINVAKRYVKKQDKQKNAENK